MAPTQTVQQPLFAATDGTDSVADLGYRAPAAARAAGITYRQLDYWARTDLVTPSLRDASGSGTQRLYAFRDIVVLRVVKRLLSAGISLQSIRTAVEWLRETDADVAGLTILSDGTAVYAETEPDVILDVLAGGQAVFAIGVGKVARDAAVCLLNTPDNEKVAPDEAAPARPALAVVAS